ncbi:MAG TPA: class I SAM-dependent methyltransferase [Candidatus Kapabacteria bacterium]|nr:class I SAM-dependent methyltransferase [Candidatus Kapabacteria bacterium]
MTFEDNFSRQAGQYALHRPVYPERLFAFIAEQAPALERAWDCATGNGQAAHGMAAHVREVIATDASSDQIAHARPHERIHYRVAPADASGLPAGSVDIVTIATALHWLDLDRFYAEVHRVLKPGGVLAAWSYFGQTVGRDIDPILTRYSREIVGPYWSPRIVKVHGTYNDLPFPFEEIEAPPFVIEVEWSAGDILGYLGSWSATQKFIEVNGEHPLNHIREELEHAWGNGLRTVRWPLTMRIGRTPC